MTLVNNRTVTAIVLLSILSQWFTVNPTKVTVGICYDSINYNCHKHILNTKKESLLCKLPLMDYYKCVQVATYIFTYIYS